MVTIYQAVAQLQTDHKSGALCTIIESSGSTPRHQAVKCWCLKMDISSEPLAVEK